MQAAKRKPLVAVLDWKTAPAGNSGVDLEAKVLVFAFRNKQAKASWASEPMRFRRYSATAEGSRKR